MENDTIGTTSSHSRVAENDSAAADLTENRKIKLMKQIESLKTLISQVESSLDIFKFGMIKDAPELKRCTVDRRTIGKVSNLQVLFRKELYKYAGFYCIKYTEHDYVVNFTSSNDDGSCETFSVQMYNNNGKVSVGRWIMPMSINIGKILSENPVIGQDWNIQFLRNCKRHVDCYTQRKNEYRKLMKYVSDMRNIKIDATAGFIIVTLQLYRVYNKSKDSFLNMTIYLSYESDETLPSIIKVDQSSKYKSESSETNAFTKYFKNYTLKESFKRMIESSNSIFSWAVEKNDMIMIESDCTSESEDDTVLARARVKRKRKENEDSSNEDLSAEDLNNEESKERWKKPKKQKTLTKKVGNRKRDTVNENRSKSEDSQLRLSFESLENERSLTNLSLSPAPKNKSVKKVVPKKKTSRVSRQTTRSIRKTVAKKSTDVDTKVGNRRRVTVNKRRIEDEESQRRLSDRSLENEESLKTSSVSPAPKNKSVKKVVPKTTSRVSRQDTRNFRKTVAKKSTDVDTKVDNRKRVTVNKRRIENEDSQRRLNDASLENEKSLKNSSVLPARKNKSATKVVLKKKTNRVSRQTTLNFRKTVANESTDVDTGKIVKTGYEKIVNRARTKPVNKKSVTPEIDNATEKIISNPVGIISGNKMHAKALNLAVTSTPVQKTRNRVKFALMNNVELSPIVDD